MRKPPISWDYLLEILDKEINDVQVFIYIGADGLRVDFSQSCGKKASFDTGEGESSLEMTSLIDGFVSKGGFGRGSPNRIGLIHCISRRNEGG